jgi:dTDP-4-amino-4,6-dideoxygalactose transaminase
VNQQSKSDSERKAFYGPLLDDRDRRELLEFVNTNRLSITGSDGPVGSFEAAFAESIGGGKALLTQSGTAAILSALVALGLKEGDEIVYPLFGFHACIMPARLLGLDVVFAPVRKDSLLLDTDRLPEFVTGRTKALFVLHVFGQPVEMDAVLQLQERFGFAIISDCSHAYGATYDSKPVASLCDIAVFSLQQNKALAAGEGGVLWSANPALVERTKVLAHPGRDLAEEHAVWRGISFGLKFRTHPLVAWLANNQLAKLPAILAFHHKVDLKLRNAIEAMGLDVHFLPVSTKRTRPAGYCYLKFRLPEEMTDAQAERFRKRVVRDGKWVKPEHFMPMSDLPSQPPFAFAHLQASPNSVSAEPPEAARLRRLLARQYSLRLPIDYTIRHVDELYGHDLAVIGAAWEESRSC